MKYIRSVWDWTMRSAWRTWVGHCLIALVLAPIVGAWTMMVFYVLREIEQVAVAYLEEAPQDWQDHFLDLSAPFVALGLASLLGWSL